MMKRKLKLQALNSILLAGGCLIFQCCSHPSTQISNDVFTICYPKGIQIVKQSKGIYSGRQIIDRKDTLIYNIGFIVSNLSEELPEVTYIPDSKNFVPDIGTSVQEISFANRQDYDIDRYRKQNVFFERSGAQIRKYTYPVDTNIGGMIGLYIDSVAWGPDGVVQFNAFVEHPSKGAYLTTLEALRTIILKPAKPDSFYISTRYVP